MAVKRMSGGKGGGVGTIAGSEYGKKPRPVSPRRPGSFVSTPGRKTISAGKSVPKSLKPSSGKPKPTPSRPGRGTKPNGLVALNNIIEAGLKKQGLKPGTPAWDKARTAANYKLTGISMKRVASKLGPDGPKGPGSGKPTPSRPSRGTKPNGLTVLNNAIEAGLKKQGLKPGTAAWNKARKAADYKMTGVAMKRAASKLGPDGPKGPGSGKRPTAKKPRSGN